jgi:hypothetical protein
MMISPQAAVESARVKYSCSAIAARRVALPRALSSHDGLLTLFPSHSAVVAVRALQLGRLDELLASPAVKRHAGHLLDGCVCNQSRLRSFWNYTKHILVPDSSPWIDYRGDWVDSGGNNTITEGYVNHTCHTTHISKPAETFWLLFDAFCFSRCFSFEPVAFGKHWSRFAFSDAFQSIVSVPPSVSVPLHLG